MLMGSLFPVPLTIPRSQNSRNKQKRQAYQHEGGCGSKEISVLKAQVPHKTEDQPKYGQHHDSKVTAPLNFWPGGRDLLVDLGDQAVDYTVISNVVILKSVGVIAQVLAIEDEPHQLILRKFCGKIVSRKDKLEKYKIVLH